MKLNESNATLLLIASVCILATTMAILGLASWLDDLALCDAIAAT